MKEQQTQPATGQKSEKWFNFLDKDGPIKDKEAWRIVCEQKKENGTDKKSIAVWFDKLMLEQLYNYIKKNGNDGIRVYFGKYPATGYEEVRSRKGPQNYSKKQTLVIVPTLPNGDGTSRDDMEEIDCEKYKDDDVPMPIIIAYNHGELCPPLKGCR